MQEGDPPAEETPEAETSGPPNLGADYMGVSVCRSCHGDAMATWAVTAHAGFVKEATEETVLGDLTDAAALTITWPDGAERPIALEDIAYVLGGRYMQQYVTVQTAEDGAPAYYVLPVQWNIPQEADQEGMWTPYHPDDWATPARDWRNACAGCHTTGLTADMVAEGWEIRDVELNVTCEACHGPGGQHIRNPVENAMVSSPDAQICGQCHIQGVDPPASTAIRWATSRGCRWTSRSSSPRPSPTRRSGGRAGTRRRMTPTASGSTAATLRRLRP
ncbi:MAG: cytochrome c family protein [Anaerolineae bacterium]|nr:cytochrome c family protein [Anaerolineae bacterium]